MFQNFALDYLSLMFEAPKTNFLRGDPGDRYRGTAVKSCSGSERLGSMLCSSFFSLKKLGKPEDRFTKYQAIWSYQNINYICRENQRELHCIYCSQF